MRTSTYRVALASLLLTAGAAGQALGGDGLFCKSEKLVVRDGETRGGDTYFMSQNVDISGTLEGDLIGGGQTIVISGVVTGDVAIGARSLDIRGQVRDSVRFAGESLTITGTVDGDVVFFGAQLNVHPLAHITGNVRAWGGSAHVEGTVDGSMTLGAGDVLISGPVGGSASVTADTVRVATTARIEGDFEYTSRKEIDVPEAAVAGEVQFKERLDDDEEEDRAHFTLRGFLFRGWWLLAALLVGSVAVALLRESTPALVAPIGREGMLVALIGLGIFLVVPAASILAIALVISAPLGVIALVLFLIGLYLAKLPVAIWLGQRLLGLCGVGAPSPFLALAVGLVPLYVLFEIPFFVGTLAYLVTVWLGLGAFVLGVRAYVSGQGEPLPASPAPG